MKKTCAVLLAIFFWAWSCTMQVNAQNVTVGKHRFIPGAPPPPPSNLVGQWLLNEGGTTSTALDSSGNGNSGTWAGSHYTDTTYYFAPGYILSNEGVFNAVNNISMSYSSELNVTGNLTVSMWVQPNANQGVFLSNLSGTGNGYELYDGNGLYFQTGNAGNYYFTAVGTVILALHSYVHICATYNGTTGTLYMNGTPQAGAFTQASAIGSSTAALNIGTRPGGSLYISSNVEDVRIYNEVSPTVKSCATLYANGPGGAA
jgi:hypothetical protein